MAKENNRCQINCEIISQNNSKRRKRNPPFSPFEELPKDVNVSNALLSLKTSKQNYLVEEFYNGEYKICVDTESFEVNGIKGSSAVESIKHSNIDFFKSLSHLEWLKESVEVPPLMKPLLLGWKRRHFQQMVNYISPNGEVFKSIHQILRYLVSNKVTNLQIDLFCFDIKFRIYSKLHYINNNAKFFNFDYSKNKELIPVPCINTIDNTAPKVIPYITKRIPSKEVNIIDDKDFLICCDCTDGCTNRATCACQQLTINSTSYNKRVNRNVGYTFKRLKKVVTTGIYECNDRCSCNSSCLNRVVQNGSFARLQMFKTASKGWGVRSLDNIPNGSFIITYVGEIKTETEADRGVESGKYGDTYFFELDFIENVETSKSKLVSDQDSLVSTDSEPLSDFDSDLELDKNEIITFELYKKKEEKKKVKLSESKKSHRKWIGNEVHIIDSQNTGNISRFFNHSCRPNMVVQTVFTNSHDVRFPQLAFFTNRNVKRGEELTFDYGYQAGTIPNRVILCTCGHKECRKRIL